MTATEHEIDLVHLAAGKDESATLAALLEDRCDSLGIRRIRHKALVHPRRDPGCLKDAAAILQTYVSRASRSLVMFDWEGSGREHRTASELEREVEHDLEARGWAGRTAAIIVTPELENWMFVESPHVPRALGYGELSYDQFLVALRRNGVRMADGKPERPKEVVEAILREKRLQRSSSLYASLARKVSLTRCADRSFLKLKEKLAEWFPA